MILTTNDYDYYELLDPNVFKIYGVKKKIKSDNVIKFKCNFDLTWNGEVLKANKNYILFKKN